MELHLVEGEGAGGVAEQLWDLIDTSKCGGEAHGQLTQWRRQPHEVWLWRHQISIQEPLRPFMLRWVWSGEPG